MERYFSAVRKMEQTVMFPSVLQEVTLGEQDSGFETDLGDKDLYEYYTLLRSIKQMAEGGLLSIDAQASHTVTGPKEQEGTEEADLEGLFHYHVSGLCRILTQLTERAKTVTSRYNQIMGRITQSEVSFSW